MKLVSIIIPYVRDRGYLQQAIASVKNQSYGHIELILSQSDKGVSHNLNRGIEKATGDYIKYLCDDDMLPGDAIYHCVDTFAKNPHCLAMHGKATNFWSNGSQTTHDPAIKEGMILKDLLAKNHMHGGSLMWHRSVFDQVGGFDETLWTGEEFEFNLRCLANGIQYAYCPYPVYLYRKHPGQKSDKQHKAKRIHAIKAIKDKYRIPINKILS
jgi:glycosyltransferase involved in cell wall biosynthesis